MKKKLFLLFCIIAAFFAFVACSARGTKDPSHGEQAGDGFSVTFAAGDGAFLSGDRSKSVNVVNGKATITETPYRDGYAFCGWYNGSTRFDGSATFTAAATFTARYVSGAESDVFDKLFDEGSTVDIYIDMSDSEWTKLDNDVQRNYNGITVSKSPTYRHANYVTIGIDDGNGDGMLHYYYKDVGVRMKGNTSRHKFYGKGAFNGAVHFKLSFKETFDDLDDGYTAAELTDWTGKESDRAYRKARTLGGMEKIDIKYNATGDETYVRELYAMKLFRENGIYAANMTLGKVSALENNKTVCSLGVYRVIEPIDESFIVRHNLDGGSVGDLYKCTWGNSGIGASMTLDNLDGVVGVNDELKNELYAYEKKTNKKKDKTTGLRDFSSIKNFLNAINGNDANVEQLIDSEYFAKFEAVNYILGNPDCIRNNANNYYLYFRKSDGKALVIPYDYDRCLGLTNQWNPSGNGMTEVKPFTRWTFVNGGESIRNPLYAKLIVKGAPTGESSVLMRYRSNLLSLIDSDGFKATAFNSYKSKYQARYGAFALTGVGGSNPNNLAFGDNKYGNIPYADYIARKTNTLKSAIDEYNA